MMFKVFSKPTKNQIPQSQSYSKLSFNKFVKFTMKASMFGLTLFLVHRQIPYFNTYEIYSEDNERNHHLVNCLLPINYRPTFYLPTCLSQMVFNEIKPKHLVNYNREIFKTSDGGAISLDWVVKDQEAKVDKILVILHGLTGGSESSYIREIAYEYNNIDNFKVVCINYRGINNSPLLTPSVFHAGYTEDLYEAMKYIQSNYPNLRCYALGTSMGANIFTKLFANHDDFNDWVKGFLSISNPMNCHEVEKRNRGSVLDYFIIRRQKNYVIKHKKVLSQKIGDMFLI